MFNFASFVGMTFDDNGDNDHNDDNNDDDEEDFDQSGRSQQHLFLDK